MAKVVLSPEAIEDILSIHQYILERDGFAQAEAILQRLENKVYSLEKLSLRGKFPDELLDFGNSKIREIQEAPWRIFYYPEKDTIFVLAVLDGRRSMADLLLERLME
ncbi:type II toxin-antitoxin system RelE/ParE family toxin [Desulfovibrio litoralis]|uniref:Toxin ParE1/3/4 n=1 Tax=Desulfovibrio litoralis DSM 11393 TaxID=1121455 RepID=A0A1M7S136_9BACT|nr:type II toxin-antitoxin system RelE/ParE family toxin [Desulfovibrio litoralis]SHN52002.1 toxin ParE1/3/4 [Desulfovibrio litoralis DSM 11393]